MSDPDRDPDPAFDPGSDPDSVPPAPELDPAEQRVLGSLLEKQITVPASYPMTLNAVRIACNQTSSREPVTDYDERAVQATLKTLREKDLVAVTWDDRGRRTLKYLQRFEVALDLQPDERALLTVLLLRGPQPAGALKTRTERLFGFEDRGAVEACLRRLAGRTTPLVRELPRGPREQDPRWIHLLGPVEAAVTAVAAAPAADREAVLSAGSVARDAKVRASYADAAAEYATRLIDELDQLPFERWLLDRVVAHADGGSVVEVGCGPGHITAYLAAAGARASGIDLSPEMIAEAEYHFPEGSYQVGDLRRLLRPVDADGWRAVLAWYSLVHLAPSELPEAVAALTRPLAPGGWLVIALHAGRDVKTVQEWWDVEVDLDFVLHEVGEVVAAVQQAGLHEVEWYRRSPAITRQETTERLYVIARRP